MSCNVALHAMYVARLRFILHVCVDCMCVCVRALGLVVCECMVVLCAIVYAIAFVCCKVVFHITRVFRSRVCFAFVFFDCLCVRVCCPCW